ncbi:pyridoxamine 5'-phosphate oxidase family protein [Kribbella sp. HUAS MG21]|uniref:Pyridoxamine 5'-phosphate oxidase family protein n=1 Tax=Kribbella sp. HUAS MG21 TaxID=3160966 RepID=A0AAU7TA99_9ACTN
MGARFAQLAFTEAVRAQQRLHGSDRAYRGTAVETASGDLLGPGEADFIADRESFYIASVSETGWPYIQHRGGPRGFLRVLDERTLGFADLRGNRQYITRGNLQNSDRVALFLMDYALQARLKLLGHARVSEDPDILRQVVVPDYPGKVEGAVLIEIEGWDWNCRQHIPQLFGREVVEQAIGSLRDRIAVLEQENARLRAGLVPGGNR